MATLEFIYFGKAVIKWSKSIQLSDYNKNIHALSKFMNWRTLIMRDMRKFIIMAFTSLVKKEENKSLKFSMKDKTSVKLSTMIVLKTRSLPFPI